MNIRVTSARASVISAILANIPFITHNNHKLRLLKCPIKLTDCITFRAALVEVIESVTC